MGKTEGISADIIKYTCQGGDGEIMGLIWTGMVLVSVVGGVLTGKTDAVAAAAMEGAQAALELAFSIGGMLCLWCGVMELMARAGLSDKLAKVLSPVLKRLFLSARQDEEICGYIAANVSANLLGLGNAATPLGLKAIGRMAKEETGCASDDMCMLVVCNAASIQLIPTTVAAVRQAAGCDQPFDILPAVCITSSVALCAGIGMCMLFRRLWRKRR